MEDRLTELERKVEVITKALLKLQEWMDSVNEIQEIDQNLFDQLDERVTAIEDNLDIP